MTSFEVAHIRHQNVNLIITPVDRKFSRMSQKDQDLALQDIQMMATSAGLAGTVVPVWDAGGGRMAFRAPSRWHAFLRSKNLGWVAANINKRISSA